MKTTNDKKYKTLPEVVRLLNTRYHKVYYAASTGKVGQRVGRTFLFSANDVRKMRALINKDDD